MVWIRHPHFAVSLFLPFRHGLAAFLFWGGSDRSTTAAVAFSSSQPPFVFVRRRVQARSFRNANASASVASSASTSSALPLYIPAGAGSIEYSFDFGVTDLLESFRDDRDSDKAAAAAAAAAVAAETKKTTTTLLIGKRDSLHKLNAPALLGLDVDRNTVETMLDSISNKKKSGGWVATFVGRHRLVLASLPDSVSRNNHPLSLHTVTQHIQEAIPKSSITNDKTSVTRILFCGTEMLEQQGPLVSALAKAFPLYSQKTNSNHTVSDKKRVHIQVSFINDAGQLVVPPETKTLTAITEGVQLAAQLVDATPEELSTDAYADICRRIAAQLDNVTITEIVGEELRQQGYGGLYGVGKAATSPPRLVILDYNNPAANQSSNNDNEIKETIALVGKGIIYDTGGLSLKPKTGMCGMKHDMAGSAGMLGGFYTAIQSGQVRHKRIVLILCLAENAIGPTAFRNDDILTLYSGKTVEINNCDAEGRLILADGVAHATRHVHPLDLVVDMATLTGEQLIATGKRHAGILANTRELEQRALQAGLQSGDLVFPLLYAPELLQSEFDSTVADMKNSVKDRNNAQSSCAGHFIEAHLHPDYHGGWLHVDMAGPATHKERGTGYGVGLVLALLQVPGF